MNIETTTVLYLLIPRYRFFSQILRTTGTIQRSQCEFQRLSRTVVLISLMYFLLTMPYAIIHFLASYYGTFQLPVYLKYRKTFESLIYIFHTLSHCNSIINPFIYAGMQTMKRVFRKLSTVVRTEHVKLAKEIKTLLQIQYLYFVPNI